MKSFLKQIEESFQSIDERDWDGDGEQESDTEEYMGVKDRAIKKALKQEDAKPDFLDLDKDGNTNEPMKSAGVSISDIDGLAKDSKDYNDFLKMFFKDPDYSNKYNKDADTIKWLKGIYDEAHLDEMSTSAGVAPYSTPNAFSKRTNPNINKSTGYKPTSKTKLHTEYNLVQEAMDHKYEQLIEGYKTFALSDPKMSPAKKVNASIKNVAKQLKEIEETIKHTSRLKTESGISHSGFGPSTSKALGKISERLIKISERVRTLGE